MGFLVDFEGIDGSGKGTQAARLHDAARAAGVRSELISFPRYAQTRFGRRIGDFLNGRFGALGEVSPYLVALLYAGDRFESREMLRAAKDANDIVVLDRYVPSNLAHQVSKAAPAEQPELRRWIEEVEYEVYGLPRPDLVVYLDVPPERAQQLIAQKSARSYTEKKADIQEADAAYLGRTRDVYHQLATNDPTWRLIQCCHQDDLRSIDEIAAEIWKIVSDARAARR